MECIIMENTQQITNIENTLSTVSMINKESTLTTAYAVKKARNSIIEQSIQIQLIAKHVDEHFSKAVDFIMACKGKLIISGMGKSGLIGQKIAATMASTGTPSFFIHPAEAFHGDLGMIQPDDVVLLITNSGETDEILKLIPSLKHFGNKVIGMTGNKESTLAKNADVCINIEVNKEVCPNNLAPTSSTTATLVMGDALAIALIHLRDFQPHQFAMFHPGGSLGKRLLTKVKDVMKTKNLPFVGPNELMHNVILLMTSSSLGLAIVQKSSFDTNEMLGVVTDGDLRRALAQGIDIKQATAEQIMSALPITVNENEMLSNAEETMRAAHIKQIIVTDNSKHVVGVLEFFQ
jgi:arabinose-5-phosphate isomerase